MLNETFDVLDMNYILFIHPIMDSCVIFAGCFGTITFFKNDHYVLGSLSIVPPEHRQLSLFIDTLELPPVYFHVSRGCFFSWVENRSISLKVFFFARARRNFFETEHILFINYIPAFVNQLYSADLWVFNWIVVTVIGRDCCSNH